MGSYIRPRSVGEAVLEAALRYPTAGERGLERLLVGGVLLWLSVFVLPAILVYGYLLRCLAAVAAGEEAVPRFDDWAGLLVDGLKALAVVVAYGLIPVVLAVAVFVPVSTVSVAGGADAGRAMAGVGALAILVLLVVALAVAYVVMAALTRLAVEGRLAAAFDLRAVAGLATTEPYLVAVVLAVVVQFGVWAATLAAVVFTLGLALLVVVPLGAFINFWVALVTVHLFGAAYREATDGTAA